MSNRSLAIVATATALMVGLTSAAPAPEDAIDCPSCAAWNEPHQPFRVYGNTYYVGTAQLSSVLIVTSAGLVLVDAALPQSVAQIEANIANLGYRLGDVKLLLNSHTHFDHAGGLSALQKATGARVVASPRSAEALRAGRPTADDPQPNQAFPAVAFVQEIKDGEPVSVGDTVLVPHFTPGHTPGGTTWTWRSCVAADCVEMVYADSLNAVSEDGFSFARKSGSETTGSALGRSIELVSALPCDVLLAPHPGFARMDEKFDHLVAGDARAFIDPSACKRYADAARKRLDERLQSDLAAERAELSREGPKR